MGTVIKRVAFSFAVVGYTVTMLYYSGPRQVRLSETLAHFFPFWPCNFGTPDRPAWPIAIFGAPINAMFWGAVGAFVGWLFTLHMPIIGLGGEGRPTSDGPR